jgi:hypothetical protein
MGAVMIWPGTPGIRFLYPLLPFYVYLVVAGLSHVTVNRARNFRQAALAALLLIIGASYLQVYRATSLSAIPETDGLASFTDMCARVSTLTNNNDVFLCRRPRALTLFAGRRAAVYQTGSDGAIWEFVRQKQVGYLLCNRREPQDVAFLLPFIARYRSNLDLIYRNEDFEVYGTRPDRPRVTASNPQPRAFPHP